MPPATDATASPRATLWGGLLAAVLFASFWPAWDWVAHRLVVVPENRTGIAAFALAALVLGREAWKRTMRPPRLLLPAILALAYAATYRSTLPHIHAVLATASVGWLLASMLPPGRRSGFVLLLLLSLPVVPSLQNHVGLPLRMAVASLSAGWVRMAGFPAVAEGTGINWDGRLILVDGPCSGIRMLWAGLVLVSVLASQGGMGLRRFSVAAAVMLAVVFAANVLRATALFFAMHRGDEVPGWYHAGVGLFSFAIAAGGAAWVMRRHAVRPGLAA